MSRLKCNQYGKALVRVLKVLRGAQHEVCELEADVLLRGDLEGSYLGPDNSSIVPTDTVKNTVRVLAYDSLGACRTSFAKVLGEHFLGQYVCPRRHGDFECRDTESFDHENHGVWFRGLSSM